MTNSAYDLAEGDLPMTKTRVALLEPDKFESFDLVGDILDEDGRAGNTLYVECKKYTSDGNQATLYAEYLAVCYSAFAHATGSLGAPASWEFMWATTHPFAQTNYSKLTTEGEIKDACTSETHKERLGGHDYDSDLGAELAKRLWLVILNDRMEEMIMGTELRKAVAARMAEMQHRS